MNLLLKLLTFFVASFAALSISGQTVPAHIYQVNPGDRWETVATKLGYPIADLKKLNTDVETDQLSPGQRLLLPVKLDTSPSPKSYTARRGDTVAKVARKFELPVSQLKALNGLRRNRLQAGQTILLSRDDGYGMSKPEPEMDIDLAQRLAESAENTGNGRNTHGYCLRGVRQALTLALKEGIDDKIATQTEKEREAEALSQRVSSLGRTAFQFKRWAEANPDKLCNELKLADANNFTNSSNEDGQVLVYNPGRCGFHRRYGHVEVLVDAEKGRVCSDHCRTLDTTCKPDLVLVPVTSCDWLRTHSTYGFAVPSYGKKRNTHRST